ncbi:DUF4861 family protein [Daejeonella sp.]|uniref:DUF4861 family protein n=1 Tax=Daejeonella sp. TaxID=2805397 RepID=UPI0030BE5E66
MKRIANNIFFCIGLVLSALTVSAQQKALARIQIRNTSSMARENEIVEVKYSGLAAKISNPSFKVIDAASKKEVPYQLEFRGYDKPVNLLIEVKKLKAKETLKLDIVPGQPAKHAPKTFARYVPERKDDFAWENDLIAFRMYGKALETASDNATGTDIWSKRTDKLVLDAWYKGNDYHTDKGEGMDYYQVGITLGAGDIAPYYQDSIILSKNYHHFKVLDNGPLRSTFRLGYDGWKVGDMEISATKTISLSAGSQLNRIEVNYLMKGAEQAEVVAGIVKRPQDSPVLLDARNGIVGYWEPEVKDKGIMGIGLLTSNPKEVKKANGHYLSRMTIKNNVPLVYYNGGAWNRAGKITTAEDWFNYLKDYKYKIDHPLTVKIK